MVQQLTPAFDRPWHRPGWFRYGMSVIYGMAKPPITVSDPPPDVILDRNAEVIVRDGTVLRANVFRTPDTSPRPVVLSAHPYAKDRLPKKKRGKKWTFPIQYRMMRQPGGVAFSGLTTWEAPDPAYWTSNGFVVVEADLRGGGASEGVADPLSRQESEDVYDIVQWASQQPWCDGRVVMLGVSYLAISQWGVASMGPEALRAICPWEGVTDPYRDLAYPGGVRETGFVRMWAAGLRQVARVAYDLLGAQKSHPLRDDYWRGITPDLTSIKVPMLVCGSFSDHTLHTRGSMRAFAQAGSTHARLYTHRGGKWSVFYSDDARAEQLAFFRQALDGPPGARSVRLEVREDRDTVVDVREEAEWPLARTHWRELHLAGPGTLSATAPAQPGSVSFKARQRAAVFSWTIPEDVEITGPLAARLWVELNGSDDAHIFVGVEKWRDGKFVPFEGSQGYGRDRVSTGFQRVALRALDTELSTPWQPVPSCTELQPVSAGDVVPLDVELLPSATVFRAGEQLRLVVSGRWLAPRNPFSGGFPTAFVPSPRSSEITLHWGPARNAHLLIPEIPK
ncbi:CocE/NonD family hydrolase [Nocardia nova]|uniref:CocE/NonD family hydrolase n=1 Tax=Nocardia nova TaxID=37330 RepID=UPI0033DAD19B